jgi:tripartite-type tricarboxylate transporter receptor subunit TctC
MRARKFGSTMRRQPRILVHVHSVLRESLKPRQLQLPGPNGQPCVSSQQGQAFRETNLEGVMKLPHRRFLHLAAAASALLAVSQVAWAQTYPSRPVTMIVPYPPGGPSDTLGRIFAERMRVSLGQPVIVENVGGAGGTIGVARVVRAVPDGHTINFSNVASHVFSSIVYKLQYDMLNDLEPVALLTTSPFWLLASNRVPAKNLRDLITWLKSKEDNATWGIVGSGNPAHLCGVYFQNHTGTRFQFVPYRGAGPAMQDLVAGQIDLSCLEASATRANVLSGKIKAFALLAKTRWTAAPDVPTIDEAGVPGFYLTFWHALWVPKDTPAGVTAKLNAAAVEALADPAVRERLTGLGVEIPPREQQTPEGLRAYHRAEIDKWRPIIDAANIKPQ